ncbi:MAG TPA: YHS domain-containing protein [Arachidicoccus sp.]
MKVFNLMTTIAMTLVVTVSCNNQGNRTMTTKVQQSSVSMKSDTAQFTLSMVDNKKDFVCRMPLTAGIGDTVHYKGKVYGFCSKGCKESFLQDPKGYLAEKL